MIVSDGLGNLKNLLQMPRYKHRHKLQRQFTSSIPKVLSIEKDPAFEPVSDNGEIKWNKILFRFHTNLV